MARWSWTKQGARNGMNRRKRRALQRLLRRMVANTAPSVECLGFEVLDRKVFEVSRRAMAAHLDAYAMNG